MFGTAAPFSAVGGAAGLARWAGAAALLAWLRPRIQRRLAERRRADPDPADAEAERRRADADSAPAPQASPRSPDAAARDADALRDLRRLLTSLNGDATISADDLRRYERLLDKYEDPERITRAYMDLVDGDQSQRHNLAGFLNTALLMDERAPLPPAEVQRSVRTIENFWCRRSGRAAKGWGFVLGHFAELQENDKKIFSTLDFDPLSTSENNITKLMMYGVANAGETHMDLFARFGIDALKFQKWTLSMKGRYLENTYHNWRHAWDVFHFSHLLVTKGIGRFLAHDDVLALFISAIAHDVGHLGRNNPHMVRINHTVAITYNDNSVMENMHACLCFREMQQPSRNFLKHLGSDRYGKIRTKIIKGILATDMMHHMGHLAQFADRIKQLDEQPFEVAPWSDESGKDRQQLLEMSLHMADISNCCRGWDVCRRIGPLLEEEFFAQGDDEKLLKLPVMPLCNRETDSLAAGQSFWIPKIVLPMLQLFTPLLLGDAGDAMEKNCENNQANWAMLVEKYGKITAGEIVKREYGYIVPKQPNYIKVPERDWFDGLRRVASSSLGAAPATAADHVEFRRTKTARVGEAKTPSACSSTAANGAIHEKKSRRFSAGAGG